MSTQPLQSLTVAEYLTLERSSQERHQYYLGEIFARDGASRNHNRITSNVGALLNIAFQNRPCEEFVADMRVRVSRAGLYTYPDVVALCEPPQFDDGHNDTLINPQVIFEVLSPSTELFDRGKKFQLYRELDSLTDYILVAQDRVAVEHFRRGEGNAWIMHPLHSTDQSLEITSLGVELPLSEIYRKVEFGTEPASN